MLVVVVVVVVVVAQGTNASTSEIPYSIFAHGVIGSTPGVRPSDSELFVLNLAAELLLATKSTAILSEELPPFGGGGPPKSVIELLLRCQHVVEEVIGVGKHSMMHMQSGDWSDLIMSRVGITYNSPRYKNAVQVAESSLNAAMASRVFARWAEALKLAQAAPSSNKLPVPPAVLKRAESAATNFAALQRKSLQVHAWNGSWFSRAWVDEEEGWVGTTADRLMLEPQSWAMMGGAVARGSAEETTLIESILTHGSTPIGHSVYSKQYPVKPAAGHPGSGAANAWPAINHPLIIALARSSKPEEAMKEWMRNSLATQAHYRPDFWAGIWTGADYTATPIEAVGGLAGWPEFPSWCTHRHAFPLWSVATGLAGVEFTAEGVTIRPAVPLSEGSFDFKARQLAVSRDADGATFRGWVQPQDSGSPCTVRLALHHTVSAASGATTAAAAAAAAGSRPRRGRAQLMVWTSSGGDSGDAAASAASEEGGGGEWVDIDADLRAEDGTEQKEEEDDGARDDEDVYRLHDAQCGGEARLHFVLRLAV